MLVPIVGIVWIVDTPIVTIVGPSIDTIGVDDLVGGVDDRCKWVLVEVSIGSTIIRVVEVPIGSTIIWDVRDEVSIRTLNIIGGVRAIPGSIAILWQSIYGLETQRHPRAPRALAVWSARAGITAALFVHVTIVIRLAVVIVAVH